MTTNTIERVAVTPGLKLEDTEGPIESLAAQGEGTRVTLQHWAILALTDAVAEGAGHDLNWRWWFRKGVVTLQIDGIEILALDVVECAGEIGQAKDEGGIGVDHGNAMVGFWVPVGRRFRLMTHLAGLGR